MAFPRSADARLFYRCAIPRGGGNTASGQLYDRRRLPSWVRRGVYAEGSGPLRRTSGTDERHPGILQGASGS